MTRYTYRSSMYVALTYNTLKSSVLTYVEWILIHVTESTDKSVYICVYVLMMRRGF